MFNQNEAKPGLEAWVFIFHVNVLIFYTLLASPELPQNTYFILIQRGKFLNFWQDSKTTQLQSQGMHPLFMGGEQSHATLFPQVLAQLHCLIKRDNRSTAPPPSFAFLTSCSPNLSDNKGYRSSWAAQDTHKAACQVLHGCQGSAGSRSSTTQTALETQKHFFLPFPATGSITLGYLNYSKVQNLPSYPAIPLLHPMSPTGQTSPVSGAGSGVKLPVIEKAHIKQKDNDGSSQRWQPRHKLPRTALPTQLAPDCDTPAC